MRRRSNNTTVIDRREEVRTPCAKYASEKNVLLKQSVSKLFSVFF